MVWLLRQRIRFFLRSSLWFFPLLSVGAALLTVPAVQRLDDWTGWTLSISVDGVRSVTGTLTDALLTFIVFVFSVLLVAVQIASAQLTPRVIALVLRDRWTKFALAFFVFAYTYAPGRDRPPPRASRVAVHPAVRLLQPGVHRRIPVPHRPRRQAAAPRRRPHPRRRPGPSDHPARLPPAPRRRDGVGPGSRAAGTGCGNASGPVHRPFRGHPGL